MQDDRAGSPSGSNTPAPEIAVSPNNPCPFLRGLVAGGFVDGHIVPLPKLTRTIEAATGEKGLKQTLAGVEIYLVALIANGLAPLRLLRSWWTVSPARRTSQRPAEQAWRRFANPGRDRPRRRGRNRAACRIWQGLPGSLRRYRARTDEP